MSKPLVLWTTHQYNRRHNRTETSVMLIVTPVLDFFWFNLSYCSYYVSPIENTSAQLVTQFYLCIVSVFQQFRAYFWQSFYTINKALQKVSKIMESLLSEVLFLRKDQNEYCGVEHHRYLCYIMSVECIQADTESS